MIQKYYGLSTSKLHKCVYDLHVAKSNEDICAICLHGFGENRSYYNSLAAQLSYFVTTACVDFVGHGDSDYLNYGEYSLTVLIRDIVCLLNHLKMKKVILIGSGLGGLISMIMSGYENTIVKAAVITDVHKICDESFFANRPSVKQNFLDLIWSNKFSKYKSDENFISSIKDELENDRKLKNGGVYKTIVTKQKDENLNNTTYLYDFSHYWNNCNVPVLVLQNKKEKKMNFDLQKAEFINYDVVNKFSIMYADEVVHDVCKWLKAILEGKSVS